MRVVERVGKETHSMACAENLVNLAVVFLLLEIVTFEL